LEHLATGELYCIIHVLRELKEHAGNKGIASSNGIDNFGFRVVGRMPGIFTFGPFVFFWSVA
jgi:hypothetical protein